MQRTKVSICKECESVLIPVNLYIIVEIAYEPAYDFRKHFINCELCPVCGGLIKSDEYQQSLIPILEDINDIVEKYSTIRPKIKFLNIEFTEDMYTLSPRKLNAIKAFVEENVFVDLKNMMKTGNMEVQEHVFNAETKTNHVETFLNTLRSLMNLNTEDDVPF